MAASKQTRTRTRARNHVRRSESGIENLWSRVLPNSQKEAVEQYRKQTSKAVINNHPVEAAICRHLADRLKTPVSSCDELTQLLLECKELSSWLPISDRQRELSRMERKGLSVTLVRGLRVDKDNEEWLIQLATQKPGRSPEGREVAVRAMEMRMRGQSWSQIEGQLLPHRRLSCKSWAEHKSASPIPHGCVETLRGKYRVAVKFDETP